MMIDHTKKLRKDLAEHADKACSALDLIRTTDPLDEEQAWVKALNELNSARVAFQMIGEQMHDELNNFHDMLIEARRTGYHRLILEAKSE